MERKYTKTRRILKGAVYTAAIIAPLGIPAIIVYGVGRKYLLSKSKETEQERTRESDLKEMINNQDIKDGEEN